VVAGSVRVVEEVHDAGGDLVEVAAVSEVGRRWRSAWRCSRVEGKLAAEA
jgi:hypothetical protein